MQRRFFLIPAICSLLLGVVLAGSAQAQIFRFGRFGAFRGGEGFRLRTPGISIDVSPWEGTTVRTPFGVRRFSASPVFPYTTPPPSAYESRRYSEPYTPYGSRLLSRPPLPYSSGAPTPREARPPAAGGDDRPLPFARSPYDSGSTTGFGVTGAAPAQSLSDRELATALVREATKFDESLGELQDGDVWQDYLQPKQIAEAFRSRDFSELDRETVRPWQVNFEAVSQNKEMDWVTEIEGFASTHQLLGEWLRRTGGQTATPEFPADDGTPPMERRNGPTTGPPPEPTPPENGAGDAELLPAPVPDRSGPEASEPPRRFEI